MDDFENVIIKRYGKILLLICGITFILSLILIYFRMIDVGVYLITIVVSLGFYFFVIMFYTLLVLMKYILSLLFNSFSLYRDQLFRDLDRYEYNKKRFEKTWLNFKNDSKILFNTLSWVYILFGSISALIVINFKSIEYLLNTLMIISLTLTIIFAVVGRVHDIRKQNEKKRLIKELLRKQEEEMRRKGLDKYCSKAIGGCRIVNQRLRRLLSAIERFRPIQKYKLEEEYHKRLADYLNSEGFSNLEVEKQTGSSRPDIIIGDIAIEVKGPTRSQDLQTIADKIARYSQYYKMVIVVLFDVKIKKRRYNEWRKGIYNAFKVPIIILRK